MHPTVSAVGLILVHRVCGLIDIGIAGWKLVALVPAFLRGSLDGCKHHFRLVCPLSRRGRSQKPAFGSVVRAPKSNDLRLAALQSGKSMATH